MSPLLIPVPIDAGPGNVKGAHRCEGAPQGVPCGRDGSDLAGVGRQQLLYRHMHLTLHIAEHAKKHVREGTLHIQGKV